MGLFFSLDKHAVLYFVLFTLNMLYCILSGRLFIARFFLAKHAALYFYQVAFTRASLRGRTRTPKEEEEEEEEAPFPVSLIILVNLLSKPVF